MQISKISKALRSQGSINDDSESIDDNSVCNDGDDTNNSSNFMSPTEEASSSIMTKPSADCRWALGQLAWARVGNFPFWPCIVTFDPVSMTYYKRQGKI